MDVYLPEEHPRRCSIDGCNRAHYAKGYCSAHYYQVRKYGTITSAKINSRDKDQKCQVPGCTDIHCGDGLCRRHYKAKQRTILQKRSFAYKGGRCENCGLADPDWLCQYEYHHVLPHLKNSKRDEIGVMIRDLKPWQKIRIELDKCSLLCANCHKKITWGQTKEYSYEELEGKTPIKIVPKGWGFEKWIANSKLYCGKLLHVHKGKRCSMHMHLKKHETFYIVSGKLEVKLIYKNGQKSNMILVEGEALTVPPGLMHQFIAIDNDAEFVEFSTEHFDSDSYRVYKGD